MAKQTGFYLMHRGWMDAPALGGKREPFCRRSAWCWLIEEACFEDARVDLNGRTVTLQRGQLAHSIRFMAEAWNWKRSAVERFIERLRTETMIETATETGRLIISICNYSRYQAKPGFTETVTGTPAGTRARHERDTSETNKNQGNKGNQGNQQKEDSALPRTAPSIDGVQGAEPLSPPDPPQLDLLGAPPPRPRPTDDVPRAIEIWNQMAGRCRLPLVKTVPRLRRRDIQARLDQVGLSGWSDAVAMVGASRNLCGDNSSGFKASIDYLARELNFARVMEGHYADTGVKPRPAAQHRANEARARLERAGLTVEGVMGGADPPPDPFGGHTLDHADFTVMEDRTL
jgi:hypothetical protein